MEHFRVNIVACLGFVSFVVAVACAVCMSVFAPCAYAADYRAGAADSVSAANSVNAAATRVYSASYFDDLYYVMDVKEFKGTLTAYYDASSDYFEVTGSKKFSAIRSSKPGVAKVKVDGSKTLAVTLKKAGTTKVSFNYGGKKRTVTLNVKKYTCPVSVFKIGSKSFLGKFKKNSAFSVDATYKGKLQIKAKKGWKIDRIALDYYDDSAGWIAIKNGARMKDDNFRLGVKMVNKSTKGCVILQYTEIDVF